MLVELLENWCAEWRPGLFPHLEGANRVHRPEYEIPEIITLTAKIELVKEDAERAVAKLTDEIDKLREDRTDWYTLLRGTGDELASAVIRSLQKLGFKNVVDVDAEAKAAGQDTALREDIQVHDRSPALIIDVKGVNGCPDDDESRQAEKHAIMRMREWKRSDVHPLTIINHQRQLPPHDRNELAYRQEIIESAKQTGLGLMTTWDLFRLLRNMERLEWTPAVVQPVLYRDGRIEPIPEHYQEVGTIVKVWKPAFGVVPNQPISIGNRVAVQVDDTFVEFEVTSLQVGGTPIASGAAGADVGVEYKGASEKLRTGAKVFLVEKTP